MIGLYCIKSIYNNPSELLYWISTGKLEASPESLSEFIAYELVMADDPKNEKKELIKSIKNDAINSTLVEYSNKFISLINEKFEILKE